MGQTCGRPLAQALSGGLGLALLGPEFGEPGPFGGAIVGLPPRSAGAGALARGAQSGSDLGRLGVPEALIAVDLLVAGQVSEVAGGIKAESDVPEGGGLIIGGCSGEPAGELHEVGFAADPAE